jgi:hypothetical protein
VLKWRELHDEELRDFYSSPSIIRVIKSRKVRWAGHVARMGEEECMPVIGGRAGRKESSRKTKTKGAASWKDRMVWCRLDWSASG